MGRADVPHALLREGLRLTASEACTCMLGRPERAGGLRDTVHLLRPGNQPGPASAIYLQWRRAADLKPRDLRKRGEDLQLACHKALVSSISAAIPTASDLTCRAAHLRAAMPKLRAKGDAVALFLSKDVLSPAIALTDPGPTRISTASWKTCRVTCVGANGCAGSRRCCLRRGAPYTFVTTEKFLVALDLPSLRDLPDREPLDDAGAGPAES